MADFLSRLAERTLGVVQGVQPHIVPEFASEPIFDAPDPGWIAKARSSDNLSDALPVDSATGRPEPTVIERPRDRGDAVPADPEAREVEDKMVPPSGAPTSPTPKLRSVEDSPYRASTRPAETGEAVDPPTEPPSIAREPEKRFPGTPVGELHQDPNAPDETRAVEAATSAPEASADPNSRSVADVLQGEQGASAPAPRASRVETTGERRATRDIANEGSEEVTRALPRGREHTPPNAPRRAARATEIASVVPARTARLPGRSDEGAALPSVPAASPHPQDLPSRTSSQSAEPELRPDLLTAPIPDESEARDGVSPSASATSNRILVKPTMRTHAHPEDDQQRPPSEPPEPIIRVSIGRVEVRATTASLPRQQAANPARLSLDDYLRSRSGGQR